MRKAEPAYFKLDGIQQGLVPQSALVGFCFQVSFH